MKILIEKRVETALRSLSGLEQRRVSHALQKLAAAPIDDMARDPEVRKITSASGERLYSYRANQRLRIIFSVSGDTCTVEDILDHDRLKRLLPTSAVA